MDGTPQRPADVPEQALWVGEAREWRAGAVDARGEKQGLHRSWRVDGSLREEVCFVDGKGVGPYRRFHPGGALAGEGEFVDGSMQGTLRTFASDTPTPEQLQPCCVPPNAWELQTDYHRGDIKARRWYDRQGRQILDSGEPHPPRPSSVPDAARYDEASARWLVGSYQLGGGKVTHWRRWSREGVLVEEEDLEDGVRHGVWRRFRDSDGVLLVEAHYQRGVLHGPYRDRALVADGYLDARASDEAGQFARGQAVGPWTLRDARGAVILERDMGVALDEDALPRSPAFARPPASPLASLSRALQDQRRPGEAIVAMARSVALTGDAAPLRACLEQLTWPRAPAARRDLAAVVIEAQGEPLAPLIAAIVRGGDAAMLLRALASAMHGSHDVALQIVDAALLLTPDFAASRLTRALVNVHLGAADAARADARRLPDDWHDQRQHLLDYVRVIFPSFDFWPARVPVATVFEEYPEAPAQSPATIRDVIQKYATRLTEIRAAVERMIADGGAVTGAVAWLPPALPALLPDGPIVLGTWTYQQSFDAVGEPSQDDGEPGGAAGAAPAAAVVEEIAVDERLSLDAMSIPILMRLARREWAALVWLCWSCGLDRVALPDAVTPPPDFGRAAGMAIERAWRCRDKLASGGLVALSKGVPGFAWEGIEIDLMPRALIEIMTEEHVEVRAMFLWLCDGTAQSPWQSDLRDQD